MRANTTGEVCALVLLAVLAGGCGGDALVDAGEALLADRDGAVVRVDLGDASVRTATNSGKLPGEVGWMDIAGDALVMGVSDRRPADGSVVHTVVMRDVHGDLSAVAKRTWWKGCVFGTGRIVPDGRHLLLPVLEAGLAGRPVRLVVERIDLEDGCVEEVAVVAPDRDAVSPGPPVIEPGGRSFLLATTSHDRFGAGWATDLHRITIDSGEVEDAGRYPGRLQLAVADSAGQALGLWVEDDGTSSFVQVDLHRRRIERLFDALGLEDAWLAGSEERIYLAYPVEQGAAVALLDLRSNGGFHPVATTCRVKRLAGFGVR